MEVLERGDWVLDARGDVLGTWIGVHAGVAWIYYGDDEAEFDAMASRFDRLSAR